MKLNVYFSYCIVTCMHKNAKLTLHDEIHLQSIPFIKAHHYEEYCTQKIKFITMLHTNMQDTSALNKIFFKISKQKQF